MTNINWLGFVALFIFLIWIFPTVKRIPSHNKLIYVVVWIIALIALMLIYGYFFAPEISFFQPNKPIYKI